MPIVTLLPMILQGMNVGIQIFSQVTAAVAAIQAANAEGRDLTDAEVEAIKSSLAFAEDAWAAQLARLRAEQTGGQQ